jgi:hypothetical protein
MLNIFMSANAELKWVSSIAAKHQRNSHIVETIRWNVSLQQFDGSCLQAGAAEQDNKGRKLANGSLCDTASLFFSYARTRTYRHGLGSNF